MIVSLNFKNLFFFHYSLAFLNVSSRLSAILLVMIDDKFGRAMWTATASTANLNKTAVIIAVKSNFS